MKPRNDIAVVIPAYNSERSIAATLQSISAACEQVAGSGRLYGVVLSDDGSRDGTVAAAKAAWNSDTPLIVLEAKENQGEAAAMMAACQALPDTVKWITILHSDDICRPDWIKTLIEGIDLAEPCVASVCCSWNTLHADGSMYHGDDRGIAFRTITKGDKAGVHKTLIAGSWWHISGSAIRIKAYLNMGGRDPRMPQCGDWALLMRWLAGGWDILYVPRVLIEYREHQASVSSQSFRKHRDIVEQLMVMSEFAHLYQSPVELTSAHLFRGRSLLRRLVSSLLRLDLQRAWRSLVVVAICMCSWLASLGKYFRGQSQPPAPQ